MDWNCTTVGGREKGSRESKTLRQWEVLDVECFCLRFDAVDDWLVCEWDVMRRRNDRWWGFLNFFLLVCNFFQLLNTEKTFLSIESSLSCKIIILSSWKDITIDSKYAWKVLEVTQTVEKCKKTSTWGHQTVGTDFLRKI